MLNEIFSMDKHINQIFFKQNRHVLNSKSKSFCIFFLINKQFVLLKEIPMLFLRMDFIEINLLNKT